MCLRKEGTTNVPGAGNLFETVSDGPNVAGFKRRVDYVRRLGWIAHLDAMAPRREIDGIERRRRSLPLAVDVDFAPRRNVENNFGALDQRGQLRRRRLGGEGYHRRLGSPRRGAGAWNRRSRRLPNKRFAQSLFRLRL